MTDQPKPRPAAKRGPLPPSGFAVPAIGLAVFFGTFSVLSLQMSAGHDPALGGAGDDGAAPPPKKRILVRRIVKKTVILPPLEPRARAGTGGGVVTASATAPAPPASRPASPPAAPAPALAPAPITRAS